MKSSVLRTLVLAAAVVASPSFGEEAKKRINVGPLVKMYVDFKTDEIHLKINLERGVTYRKNNLMLSREGVSCDEPATAVADVAIARVDSLINKMESDLEAGVTVWSKDNGDHEKIDYYLDTFIDPTLIDSQVFWEGVKRCAEERGLREDGHAEVDKQLPQVKDKRDYLVDHQYITWCDTKVSDWIVEDLAIAKALIPLMEESLANGLADWRSNAPSTAERWRLYQDFRDHYDDNPFATNPKKRIAEVEKQCRGRMNVQPALDYARKRISEYEEFIPRTSCDEEVSGWITEGLTLATDLESAAEADLRSGITEWKALNSAHRDHYALWITLKNHHEGTYKRQGKVMRKTAKSCN